MFYLRRALEVSAVIMPFFIATQLVGIFKISFIVGSQASFLSATNCIVPLSGAFFGTVGVMLLFGLRLFFTIILHGGLFHLSYLINVIPGLCAGYYWASRSIIIRFLLPLSCMALFVMHPVGRVAWVYSLYWLIPIMLFFVGSKKLFSEVLGSTFVAHAVGSVIWLYCTSMPASLWHALIPIVFVERLLISCGMVLIYKVAHLSLEFVRLLNRKYVAHSA